LLIELVPKYVIEITLHRIEYLKSAALVVKSDKPRVICLLCFIRKPQPLADRYTLYQKICSYEHIDLTLKTLL
jgi:hypothetical protein